MGGNYIRISIYGRPRSRFCAHWMRERASPRALLRGLREQLPDAIETLKQLPRIFKTGVRAAADGQFRLGVASAEIEELRKEVRAAGAGRDTVIAAGALWLSGLIWLALAARHPWFGWLQMGAGVALFARARRVRARS